MSELVERQGEFAAMVAQFIPQAMERGYQVRFGDAWRNTTPLKCPHCESLHSYQDMLVFNGLSKKKASQHADRLAVDFVIERLDGISMTDADWIRLGEIWEDLGGKDWGGRYGVPPDQRQTVVGWDRGHFGA